MVDAIHTAFVLSMTPNRRKQNFNSVELASGLVTLSIAFGKRVGNSVWKMSENVKGVSLMALYVWSNGTLK